MGVAQHRASVTQSYFTGEVSTGQIIGESTFTGESLGRGIVALVDDTSEVISNYCSAHFFKGAPFGPFVSPSKQLSNYYDSTVSGYVKYPFNYPDSEATALATDAMKRSSELSGLGDFSSGGVWVIREDSTYPGLRSVDNAPFGFADVWHTNGTFSLSHFLENDYDVETRQQHLILHVDSLVGGTTDSTTELKLTKFSARVVYRVGEVRESHGDTLWGNRVEASLSWGDSTYEGLQKVQKQSPVQVHFISDGLDFRGIRGRVDIYDVRGNRVTSIQVLRDGFIDLSLSPGVYLVRSAGKNWMLQKQE